MRFWYNVSERACNGGVRELDSNDFCSVHVFTQPGSRAGMPGTRSACLLYPWIAVAIVAPPRPSAPCQVRT
jgi:hypothetical protein